jgi:uncharacterized protein YjbJ (UPF0337 family)
MNWDRIKGQWRQAAGRVQSAFGKAKDDDAMNLAGKREQLVGKLQGRYGELKESAEAQLDSALAHVLPDKTSKTSRDPKVEKNS